jgi:hypothetical protein
MKKNSFVSKFSLIFILSLITFLLLSIFLIKYKELDQYGINTNTISFISIAQKYIRGEFNNAVNGAFAPLFSWLLIPFLKLNLNPLLAVRVLNLIIGLLLLIGVRILSYRFEMKESIRDTISFIAVPIVLQDSLRDHTADLLVVCILVYYLNIIFNPDYSNKVYKGILSGLIGAIGYLSKAYVFPFFISHFLLFNGLHYFKIKEKKKKILRNAMLGMIIFFIISGPWIVILSNKYNKITLGTSGTYNHRVMGPEVPKPKGEWIGWEGWRRYIRMGHPVYDQGFFPPPNETALSAWEDFTYLIPYLKPWSPLESWDFLKHQIKLILKNIYYTIGILESSFSIFSIVIIIGYILFCIPSFLQDDRIFPLLTIILYSGGYILLHPDERYLWIVKFLILLMGGYLLNVLFQSDFFNDTRKRILMIFFILSFIALPLNNLRAPNFDKEMYGILSKKLEKYNSLTGKIASNDKFSETLKLLFYSRMKMRYYGQAKKDISEDELKRELKKYDIDYYLVWEKSSVRDSPKFLSLYREITRGEIPGLKIYSLKIKNQT